MTEAAMMDIFQQGCLCTNIFTLCAVYFLRSWNEDGEKKKTRKKTHYKQSKYVFFKQWAYWTGRVFAVRKDCVVAP